MPRKQKTHQLKILTEYFFHVVYGSKPFEIRKNDRDYQIGDFLDLNEWDGENYTGNGTTVLITYICDYMQKDGYVVIGIKRIDNEK